MPEKHVLTGGPGVGKTTTLLVLERMGCPVVPEAARMVIAEEQAKPDGCLPWTTRDAFQRKVMERQLILEERVRDGTAILDRGLIDIIAFHRYLDIPMHPELPVLARQQGYRCAFLLEPLPTYVTDAQRKEDPKTAAELHDMIAQTYRDFGYTLGINLFTVPVMTPDERARHILTMIERGGA